MGLYYKKNKIAGINFLPRLTLAEYNNLTVKPKYWIRTDTPDGYLRLNATNVSYNNSINVKDKIDEVDLTDGGTVSGRLYVDAHNGTTTSDGTSTLEIGNNIASGVNGNSRARLWMYSNNDKSARVYVKDNMEANRNIYFPDNNGTLALFSDLKASNLENGIQDGSGSVSSIITYVKSTLSGKSGVFVVYSQTASDTPFPSTVSCTMIVKPQNGANYVRLFCFYDTGIYFATMQEETITLSWTKRTS